MKDLYYFYYKVQHWNDFYEKEIITEGIIAGSSFKEVTDRLLQYYGDEEIVKLTVDFIPDQEVVFPLKEYSLDGNILEEHCLN